jgi:DNA (cytosine-5)-methyltransferase 1
MEDFKTLLNRAGFNVPDAAKYLGYSEGHIYRWIRDEDQPRQSVIKLLELMISNKQSICKNESFRFIDLFAGIGGLRKSMESINGKCVFTSEWDKYAQQTYMANFADNRPIMGDICKIDASEIPVHDVLVAGFPCQPFSIAGVSKKNSLGRSHGFSDETQGTLFFDILRILKHHRPAAFLLENVKNLKSHDKGRTFEIIKQKLTNELGYTLDTIVIDAAHFVPQHRQRIIMVGFRSKVDFNFEELNLPPRGSKLMKDILHSENGLEEPEGHFTTDVDAKVNNKYILSDKLWNYLKNYAAKHKAAGNGFGYGLVDGDCISRTLSARYYKDGSEILINRGDNLNPRRLTPRECARLMGYEDTFKIPVSDTQSYKQFGNSVVVPVFNEIARLMHPYILKTIELNEDV